MRAVARGVTEGFVATRLEGYYDLSALYKLQIGRVVAVLKSVDWSATASMWLIG